MGVHKKLRTTQERRKWFDAIEWRRDWPQMKVRWKRSSQHLPNAWDDEMIELPRRSWKQYRRTRWKAR